MVLGLNGLKRKTEANKADLILAVSTKIDESTKAVSYRQTHTQIM